jgi:GntR family transcriptional regulator
MAGLRPKEVDRFISDLTVLRHYDSSCGHHMVIQINPHSGVPVYRQVSDQIRFQITAGLIPPGEPIESVRNLAASLGLNSMTVSKAYSLLEREGVLERRRGQQLVVAEANSSEKQHAEEAHVREALVPAVRMIRQFQMSEKKALAIFRAALAANTKESAYETHR